MMKRIQRSLKRGNCKEALDEVERMLSAEPDNSDALSMRAKIYMTLAEYAPDDKERETCFKNAEGDLLRLLSREGETAKLARRGLLLLHLDWGDYEKAVEYGEIVVRDEEESATARLLYAQALFSRNPDRTGAVQALHLVEDETIFPYDMRIAVSELKCRAYDALGMLEEADREADYLLRRRVDDAERYKAMVLADMGRMEETLPYVERLYRRCPGDVSMLRLRAEAYFCSDQFESALKDCAALAEKQATDSRTDEIAAGCRYYLACTDEQYEEALRLADEGLSREPDNGFYIRLRGKCCHALERYEEAAQAYDKLAAASDLFDASLEFDRAMLCAARCDWNGAKVCLHHILEEEGDAASVYYELGRIALLNAEERSELEDGLLYLKKSYACGYRCSSLLKMIAGTLHTLGRYDELKEFLGQPDMKREDRALRYMLTGDLCADVKEFPTAVRWYRKANKAGADARYQELYNAMAVGSESKRAKARQAFERYVREAAEIEENVGAQRFLAYVYAFGWNGVPRDPQLAFRYAAKAATDTDYSCAQSLLGRLYLLGIGTERDEEKAVTYFEQAQVGAVYLGCTCANGLLAHCYINGMGVKKDENKAKQIVLRAAENYKEIMHENAAKLYAWFALRGDEGFELPLAYEALRANYIAVDSDPSVARLLILTCKSLHKDEEAARCEAEFPAVLAHADTYAQEYMAQHAADKDFYPAMSNL